MERESGKLFQFGNDFTMGCIIGLKLTWYRKASSHGMYISKYFKEVVHRVKLVRAGCDLKKGRLDEWLQIGFRVVNPETSKGAKSI